MVQPMLSQSIIEEIIATLEPGDEPFLVGGQATNFWAERYYDKDPGLAAYSPFNSKDIDFFGSYDAASKLAKTLGEPCDGQRPTIIALRPPS